MMASARGGADAALVVSTVAAVFAGLAAVFAGWSAWSSHRSAQLAAQAVKLERDRHHRELNPRIELGHGQIPGTDDEGVWFFNAGPAGYDDFAVEMAPPMGDQLILGFEVEDDVVTELVVGRLPLGSRRFLRYRRVSDQRGGTLRLRLICPNDQGTWTIPAEVEIPGEPTANIF